MGKNNVKGTLTSDEKEVLNVNGVLTCPHCQGNILTFLEWVPVEYDALRIEGKKIVVDMSSQDFDADGSIQDSLFCETCEATLLLPSTVTETEFEGLDDLMNSEPDLADSLFAGLNKRK